MRCFPSPTEGEGVVTDFLCLCPAVSRACIPEHRYFPMLHPSIAVCGTGTQPRHFSTKQAMVGKGRMLTSWNTSLWGEGVRFDRKRCFLKIGNVLTICFWEKVFSSTVMGIHLFLFAFMQTFSLLILSKLSVNQGVSKDLWRPFRPPGETY